MRMSRHLLQKCPPALKLRMWNAEVAETEPARSPAVPQLRPTGNWSPSRTLTVVTISQARLTRHLIGIRAAELALCRGDLYS